LEPTVSDDGPVPPDDAAPRVPATQVATVRTDFGVTVIGDPDDVDAYLDQFAVDTGGLRMSLPPARVQQAFGKGGLLASFGINTVAKYMSRHDIVATPAEARTGPAEPNGAPCSIPALKNIAPADRPHLKSVDG